MRHFEAAFQSTRPLRGATDVAALVIGVRAFQSTRPLRGATSRRRALQVCAGISIHAPLAGRDASLAILPDTHRHFNPRAPCGARRLIREGEAEDSSISIHAPLAGRDTVSRADKAHRDISIHAPLAGRDFPALGAVEVVEGFQSTRPLRGATPPAALFLSAELHFNPRAPCGARRHHLRSARRAKNFNPRAPCGARQPAHDPR